MPKVLSERKAWLKLAAAFKKPRVDRETHINKTPLNYNGICYAIPMLRQRGFISYETLLRMSEKISNFCKLKHTDYPFGSYRDYKTSEKEIRKGDKKRVAYCLERARELDEKS